VERPIEHRARGPDEGMTLQVLLIARRLADHHQFGRREALSGNALRCRFPQGATSALIYGSTQFRDGREGARTRESIFIIVHSLAPAVRLVVF
jgi:hypothetical protein